MTTDPNEPEPQVTDTGLQCLLLMARLHGIAADAAQLQHQFGHEAFGVQTLLLAARKLGMSAKEVRQDPAAFGARAFASVGAR